MKTTTLILIFFMHFLCINAYGQHELFVKSKGHLFTQDIKQAKVDHTTKQKNALIQFFEKENIRFVISKSYPNWGREKKFFNRRGKNFEFNDYSKHYIINIENSNIDIDHFINQIKLLPNIAEAYVIKDKINTSYTEPYDPAYTDYYSDKYYSNTSKAWHLKEAKFDKVWPITTGTGTIIGIDEVFVSRNGTLLHEDLKTESLGGPAIESLFSANDRYYFTENNIHPDAGHFLQVAGMMSSQANAIHTVGASYSSRLLQVNISEVIRMLANTAQFGYLLPDVINMSFLYPASSPTAFHDEIEDILKAGIVIVAGNGNNHGIVTTSTNMVRSPINFVDKINNTQVISIAALGYQKGWVKPPFNHAFTYSQPSIQKDLFAWDGIQRYYSYDGSSVSPTTQIYNYSDHADPEIYPEDAIVDLAAPGIGIFTLDGQQNNYNKLRDVNGTSFAAPLISSTVALMKSVNPDLTFTDIYDNLTKTAERTNISFKPGLQTITHSDGQRVWDRHHGYGALNAFEAVIASIPELVSLNGSSRTLDKPFYRVKNDIYVRYGATLTIPAGTTIVLDKDVNIIVEQGGKIVSNGTFADPVRFMRTDKDEAWDEIHLNSSGNQFTHTIFEGGYENVNIASINNTFTYCRFKNSFRNVSFSTRLDGGSGLSYADFTTCIFENATQYSIFSSYGSFKLIDCEIKNSATSGIYLYYSDIIGMRDTYIHDINNDGIYLANSSDAFFSDNGIGKNKFENNGQYQIYSSSSSSFNLGENNGIEIGGYNTLYAATGGPYIQSYGSPDNKAQLNYWASSSYNYGNVDDTLPIYYDAATAAGPSAGLVAEKKKDTSFNETEILKKIEEILFKSTEELDKEAFISALNLLKSFNSEESKAMMAKAIRTITEYESNSIALNQMRAKGLSSQKLKSLKYRLYRALGDFNLIENELTKQGFNLSNYTLEDQEIAETFAALKIMHQEPYLAIQTIDQLTKRTLTLNPESPIVNELQPIVTQLSNTSKEFMAKRVVTNETEDDETSNKLLEAYPNPFNPTTNISFSIGSSSQVLVQVYNITGQKVATLANKTYGKGSYTLQFDALKLPTGIYIVRAVLGNTIQTNKITLIK